MVPELLGDLSIPDDELEFWIGVLYKWVQAKDRSERKKVIEDLLDTKSNNFIDDALVESSLARLNKGEYPTVILSDLMMRSKGILYKIGCEMWRHRIARVGSLPQFVIKGPEQMEIWVKYYYEGKLD
jgi:hypothetical protein